MLNQEFLFGDDWVVEAIYDTWKDGLFVEPYIGSWSLSTAKEMCKAIEEHMHKVKRNYIIVHTSTPKLVKLMGKVSGAEVSKVPETIQGYEIYVLEKD